MDFEFLFIEIFMFCKEYLSVKNNVYFVYSIFERNLVLLIL